MLIFFYFSNFDRVPPRPLEISGRQNRANVGNLAHFPQKATKKQQMLKNDVFWDFWRFEIFENFWPTTPKFQKYAQTNRNFCRPPNLGVVTLGPRKPSETRGRIFWPILTSKHSQMQNFTRFFTLKIFLRDRNFWP